MTHFEPKQLSSDMYVTTETVFDLIVTEKYMIKVENVKVFA